MKFQPKPFVVEKKRRSRQKSAEPKSIWADTPGWDPHAFTPTDGSLQQEPLDNALAKPNVPAPAVVAARDERILPDRSVRIPRLRKKSARKPPTRRDQTLPSFKDAVVEAAAESDELNVPPFEIAEFVPATATVAGSETAASDTTPASKLPSKPPLGYRTRRLLATKGLPPGQRWKRLLPKAAR